MSDRYKFLKDYKDPLNTNKTFLAGSTARMDDATGAALIADGTVIQVSDFTPQRKDALAPGGCTELSPQAKAVLLQTNQGEIQTGTIQEQGAEKSKFITKKN
jgi:hypothetical protein